jgi:VanZ family protein
MFRLIEAIKPYSKYLLVAWIIIILTMSSIPSLPTLKIQTEKSTIRLDYLLHFCEYGLLAFLAYLTFADNRFKVTLKKYLIVTSALILFAVLDEFHQKLIPGRSFNVKDICSNILGIVAALFFCFVVLRMIKTRSSENA